MYTRDELNSFENCYTKKKPLYYLYILYLLLLQFYIGRSGQGLRHEKLKLGLLGNRFCGGPTVIYSRPALKGIYLIF